MTAEKIKRCSACVNCRSLEEVGLFCGKLDDWVPNNEAERCNSFEERELKDTPAKELFAAAKTSEKTGAGISSIAELKKAVRDEGIATMTNEPTEERSEDRMQGKIDGLKFAEKLIAEFEAGVRGRIELDDKLQIINELSTQLNVNSCIIPIHNIANIVLSMIAKELRCVLGDG